MTRKAAFALTAVLLLVAGCGVSKPDHTRPATASGPAAAGRSSASVSASPATLASGCGTPGRDRLLGLVGYPGAPPALVLGSGTRGVVLSNQDNYLMCRWFPFARTLADRGYLVLLYNYASGDAVADVRVAAATIRRAGARQLVLVGGSRGAKASLLAAAGLSPPVQGGVVSLSAEESLHGRNVVAATAGLRLPLLVVTASGDQYGSNLVAPRLVAAAKSADKRLLTVAGKDHGQDLLTGGAAGAVMAAVTSFLSRTER